MKNKNKYFYLLLLAGMYSTYIFYSFSNVIHNFLNGALVGYFIAYLAIISKAAAVIYACNTFKKNTFGEMCEILFGKILGRGITYIYILINFQLSYVIYRGLIQIGKQYMLPTTPILVLSIFLIFVPAAGLLNDEKSFLRLMGYFSIVMLLYSIIGILLAIRQVNIDFIVGTITHSLKVPSITTIATASFFHSSLASTVYFNPEFDKLSFKKTFWIITVVGIPVTLWAILIPAGIWGPYAARYLALAMLDTTDCLHVDLFFIERVVYILLPLLFLFGATQMLIYLYTGYGLLKKRFKKKSTGNFLTALVLLYFIIMSNFIKNTETLEKVEIYSFTTYFLISMALTMIFPIAIKIKKKRGAL